MLLNATVLILRPVYHDSISQKFLFLKIDDRYYRSEYRTDGSHHITSPAYTKKQMITMWQGYIEFVKQQKTTGLELDIQDQQIIPGTAIENSVSELIIKIKSDIKPLEWVIEVVKNLQPSVEDSLKFLKHVLICSTSPSIPLKNIKPCSR